EAVWRGLAETYSTRGAKDGPRRGEAGLITGHLGELVDKKRAKNGPRVSSRFRIGERTKGTPLFQNGTGTRENGLVESRVRWDKYLWVSGLQNILCWCD